MPINYTVLAIEARKGCGCVRCTLTKDRRKSYFDLPEGPITCLAPEILKDIMARATSSTQEE